MSRIALPRPIGATVSVLAAMILLTAVPPAASLAAPPAEGGGAPLTISPSPVVLPTTTVGNQSQSVEFELLNSAGEEEASIEKVLIEGEDSGEFGFAGSNCGALQPSGHCSAWISFKPSSLGAKHSTLYVRFAGGRPEQSFEVSGTAVPAHFSFQPGSYDFGLRPVHSESASTTLQIENDGQAGAQVNSLGFNGGNANGLWFGNSDCFGRWMEPGETCSVQIYFGPNETGPVETRLQLNSNNESFSAEITGEGGRPNIEASPSPADFGAATVGTDGFTRTIVIANSGNVPAGFFIGVIAGGDAGSFRLLDESCTSGPLMPSGTCTAHVRFTPQGAGPKTARLAFFGEGEGGAMVTLSGEGIAPAVTLAPSAYDFGSRVAGGKSPAHTFAVRNEGGAPVALDSVAIVGADLDQFALAGEECSGAELAPGAECLLRVRFAPDSAGAKTATLRVRGDAGTYTAALAGTGLDDAGPPAAAGPGTPAAAQTPDLSRPSSERRRRRHFARGDAVASVRSRSHRSDLRGSIVPR